MSRSVHRLSDESLKTPPSIPSTRRAYKWRSCDAGIGAGRDFSAPTNHKRGLSDGCSHGKRSEPGRGLWQLSAPLYRTAVLIGVRRAFKLLLTARLSPDTLARNVHSLAIRAICVGDFRKGTTPADFPWSSRRNSSWSSFSRLRRPWASPFLIDHRTELPYTGVYDCSQACFFARRLRRRRAEADLRRAP
jgi:hypothetical protein